MHHFPPARRLIPPPLPPLSRSQWWPVVSPRRSCATQPAGRVGGPARVEFSPQAGQPNGNKKLRQTALPTPQRPVNIVAERERERAWPKAAPTTAAYTVKGSSVDRLPFNGKAVQPVAKRRTISLSMNLSFRLLGIQIRKSRKIIS